MLDRELDRYARTVAATVASPAFPAFPASPAWPRERLRAPRSLRSRPGTTPSASSFGAVWPSASAPPRATVHPNARLIDTFYTCLGKHDAAGMIACCAPDVEFADAIFPDLVGDEAFARWRMLEHHLDDLHLEVSDIAANDASGRASLEASYTFRRTGRRVHGRIDASFIFRGGRIVRLQDHFDLHAWAGMALGLKGKLLGGLLQAQSAIRGSASEELRVYMSNGKGDAADA